MSALERTAVRAGLRRSDQQRLHPGWNDYLTTGIHTGDVIAESQQLYQRQEFFSLLKYIDSSSFLAAVHAATGDAVFIKVGRQCRVI